MSRERMRILLPWIVLAMGAAAAVLLARSREAPERRLPPQSAPLVEVMTVSRTSEPAVVWGQGTIRPRHVVEVVPQVPGRVVRIHPALVGGGAFREGDLLIEIDPRDFELALRKSEAELAGAEVRVETEHAEALVARYEWERLRPNEEPKNPFVVRDPQVKQAEAELAAAQADLDRAHLDLERTRLTATFDGRVETERVEVGQYLAVGQSVATVYSTRRLEVPLPLEDGELAWFELGDPCDVEVRFAGASHRWPCRIERIEGVDPDTRMVTVVAEIEDAQGGGVGKPDLLPGMFAVVTITGDPVEGVPIPRSVLRVDDQIWRLDGDDRLRIDEVEVGRSDRERALVLRGLEDGARVVVTPLDAVTDGMQVRVAEPADRGGS